MVNPGADVLGEGATLKHNNLQPSSLLSFLLFPQLQGLHVSTAVFTSLVYEAVGEIPPMRSTSAGCGQSHSIMSLAERINTGFGRCEVCSSLQTFSWEAPAPMLA